MANLEMKIIMADLDPIKELLDVLAKNIDKLPNDVLAVMSKIADVANEKAE